MFEFTHREIHPSFFPDLKDHTSEEGRTYITPEGNRYHSVTTFLSAMAPESKKRGLAKWRAEVGDEEADRITNFSLAFGSEMHERIEHRINNESTWLDGANLQMKMACIRLTEVLQDHLSNVVIQEVPMYSDTLCLAGRTDCVGMWDGKLSIIDFKNSRKMSRREWITSYFHQATIYAMMFEERTTVPIPQIVIPMVSQAGQVEFWTENSHLYRSELLKMVKDFKEKRGD